MAQPTLIARKGEDADFAAVTATTVTASGAITAAGLTSSGALDLDGQTLVLDTDGDSKIVNTADDAFDIYLNNAVDFVLTANTLTAASGSTIKSNTIAETTAGNGVDVDSVLLKDGSSKHLNPVTAVTADGAISVPAGQTSYFITKAGVAAMTIVDPTATTHDGLRLTFIANTANAHTLSNAAGSGFNSGGAATDVGTFGGAIGDNIVIEAYQGKWHVISTRNVTLG